MKATMFKPFSIATVAENKPIKNPDGSICRTISATPDEDLPFIDGAMKENVTSTEYKGVDGTGAEYQGSFDTDNTVTATWLPFGSNRVTPPDVRRGMRVMLYRMGEDENKLYWRYMGLDDNLMKLETVIFAFCVNPDIGKDEIDIDSCYFFEVSGHQKHVLMHTSTANGEPFEYLFRFDTGNGNVELKDNIENRIYLESAARLIKLTNADGTNLELNKQDINFYAPRHWNGVVGRNVSLKVGGNVTWDIGGDIYAKAGGTIKFETGASYFELRGDGTTLQTPHFKGKQ